MLSKNIIVAAFLLVSAAIADPSPSHVLSRRWVCSGRPAGCNDTGAYACQPKADCSNEDAWGACATEKLIACNEPGPNYYREPTACQKAGFDFCDTNACSNSTMFWLKKR